MQQALGSPQLLAHVESPSGLRPLVSLAPFLLS
jgi:hypothetical protein